MDQQQLVTEVTRKVVAELEAKYDLKNMATKDDLKGFATKEDFDSGFRAMRDEIKQMREEMHVYILAKGAEPYTAEHARCSRNAFDAVYSKIKELLDSDKEGVSASVEVGIIVTLFNQMIEYTMNAAVHAAHKTAPFLGDKSLFATIGSGLKLTVLRPGHTYGLAFANNQHLHGDVRDELRTIFTEWMPAHVQGTGFVRFGRMAYWVGALKMLRNITMHESIQYVTGGMADAGSNVCVLVPKCPVEAGKLHRPDAFSLPAGWLNPAGGCDAGEWFDVDLGVSGGGYDKMDVKTFRAHVKAAVDRMHVQLSKVYDKMEAVY